MKNELKIAYFLTLLLSSDISISSENLTNQDTKKPNPSQTSQFIGRWSPNCERFGGINIQSKNNIIIEVNANQIYITSHGAPLNSTLDIFLDHPDDLGRGGMMLNWNLFSKNTPIAKFTLVSSESAEVEWFGFYNVSSKSREWVNESDLAGPDSLIFSKCSE